MPSPSLRPERSGAKSKDATQADHILDRCRKPMTFPLSILALVTVTHIIGASAQYGINTFAPFYQDELGLTRAQVGLFFTAFYIGMAGFSFTAGWFSDRLGVRRASLIGHVFAGTAVMFASLGRVLRLAFACFLLTGLGYSFLNPASTKGVLMWFQRHRATAMGIKQTGVPGGGVLTALVGAPLAVISAGAPHWRAWARSTCCSARPSGSSGASPPTLIGRVNRLPAALAARACASGACWP